jgi:Zn-dependent M28 family amino/carboxypeptidase
VLPSWWLFVGVAAVAGSVPVIATTVGARSPGALDNASGVAAVLVAAETTRGPVGVCLTSAEELGLAGARAWVLNRRAAIAVNCDGVDDGGTLTCMHSGTAPAELLARVVKAARACGASSVRAHRLLPGVLTDGVALADAGWDVVTLSKGGVGTLARIHTVRDRAELLSGTGIAEVARILARLVDGPT